MFFRLIFYFLLALLLWRVVRRVFIGVTPKRSLKQQENKQDNHPPKIDYNDIDDAKYEDIDKQ